RDHHATIFVAPEAASAIEAARRAWDPGMAAQIAAHVTLASWLLIRPFSGLLRRVMLRAIRREAERGGGPAGGEAGEPTR
ncbi:MAG TPA: hypothetical protein VML54_16330, partial [Candidatus Limnocylindrales bacterium]|nr:hypothetical protein [Candidatus Limnocylindrales bacterium]